MMNDGAELVKAGVEAVLKPVTDLIDKIAGPAAEELGLTIQDQVRVFRFRLQLRLWHEVKQICEEAGIQPQRVPLKVLLPIVENASLEEDDDLQEIWANLLANAADPRQLSPVLASFVDILKELSAQDVKFLDKFYTRALERVSKDWPAENVKHEIDWLLEMYGAAGLARRTWSAPLNSADLLYRDDLLTDMRDLNLTLDVLLRNGLLTKSVSSPVIRFQIDPPKLKTEYSLTHLGTRFVAACKAPTK